MKCRPYYFRECHDYEYMANICQLYHAFGGFYTLLVGYNAGHIGRAVYIFARLNTGIVGSNPARGMDVCVYSVFVLSCVGSGLATG
jgi:hypothetical protein